MKKALVGAFLLSVFAGGVTLGLPRSEVTVSERDQESTAYNRALDYLLREKAELPSGTTLRHYRTRTSPIGSQVIFQQTVNGMKVLDGYVGIFVVRDGRILKSWTTATSARTSTVKVGVDKALELARDVLSRPVESGRAARVELGASPEGSVYRIEIPALEPAGVWRVHIDATTGKMVGSIEDVARYVDGKGKVFHVSASVALETNTLKDQNDSASAVPADAYEIQPLLGLDGSGYLVGPYSDCKSNVPRNWRAYSRTFEYNYDRNPNQFEGVMAYWGLDYAQRYIQSLGFDDVNNRQIKVAVDTYPQDNSFYSAGTITYGAGGVDDAEDSEVVWHEMGHAIQDDQVPGWGATPEAGSMGEGFGDYIAASVGSMLSGGFQDACVAEWDAVSYSSTNPPCLRRVDSDKHYPEDMEGEVHADGEIWSAALWDCRAVVGNDRAVANTIAHHFLLSPGSSFTEAAEAYLIAAEELGSSPAELQALEDVFVDRGIL